MNILLIVCDTLRADHLGCYEYFRETSPNIDRIAREGVIFEDFYNAGCPTGPGFACIYTGLHTIRHKYYRFLVPNNRQVDDTIFTMAEILRAMGYTTAAFDNLMNMMDRPKHSVRGYEFYINSGDYFPHHAFHEILGEQVNRRLIPWIKEYSDEKFFLLVHYWDPHGPYNQPKEYRNLFHHEKGLSDLEVREAPAGYKYIPGWGSVDQIIEGEKLLFYGIRASVDIYDGEIAYVDHVVGEVIEALETEGVLDETLVMVTSDHGEQLGQHYNTWSHIGLHDAVTHIPLVMRYPKKLPKGTRVKGFCQHIDILPTLLDLLDVKATLPEVDGESLMPLIKGKRIRERIFMEHSYGQRAIRTAEWKLITDEWRRRPHRELELYHVEEDPMEVINLAEARKEKAQDLREALHRWVGTNLKGEPDPIIYPPLEGNLRLAYRVKYKELLESLNVSALDKW